MLVFIVERLNYVDSIAVKAMNKHKIKIRNKVIIVLITTNFTMQITNRKEYRYINHTGSACSVLLDELSFFVENVAYIDLFILT